MRMAWSGCWLMLIASGSSATGVGLDVNFYDDFEAPTPSVFRLGDLKLRDPHVFYNVPVGSFNICTDVTDVATLGLNAQIAASLIQDSDSNGTLDNSPLLVFRPLRADAHPARLQSRAGDCSVATPRTCTPGVGAIDTRIIESFNVVAPTYCLEPIGGTTSSWGGGAAAVPRPTGLCYLSSEADLVLSAGGLPIPLFDAQYAAPLPNVLADVGGGLMRGFLRESDAALVIVPINGTNQTLASLLPGGVQSCKADVAGGKDTWLGQSGWWFYFEYRQDPVQATGF
ncbi:MAG: hypothetical protein ABI411_01185 [Tahibacter sp.]